MKKNYSVVLIIACLFSACAGQSGIIFIPEHTQEEWQIDIDPFESWDIIESSEGPGETGIPEWVRYYYNNKLNGIESLGEYSGRYIITAENRGENFNAMNQWANGFSAVHDLPRLITARVERRLVSAASLYPDDEYGQYFENLIKAVSDGDYPGAVKEEVFWLKRKVFIRDEENGYDAELPQTETILERYEFLILISMDRDSLQRQLREIIENVRTTIPATREQAANVARIQQTFFEGF
ncbi:MAG: hypothetical protein FWG89_03770 [Treponema sp.]|nr:hypothetical protein [Treponema sp.]